MRTKDSTQGKVALPGYHPLHFIMSDKATVRLLYVQTGVTCRQQNQEGAMLPGQHGIAPVKLRLLT